MTNQDTTKTSIKEESKFFDKAFHVWLQQQLGLSPAYILSLNDWFMHLSISPETQMELIRGINEKFMRVISYIFQFYTGQKPLNNIGPQAGDRRFRGDLWKGFPFNVYAELFLSSEEFWNEAINNVSGITKHHKLMNNFMLQQLLNIISPTNFIFTNPEILEITKQQQGKNFIKGFNNLVEDLSRTMAKLPPHGMEEWQVGKNLAITPGKVVYKNDLIELIQYTPTTEQVYKEPILIVPACIMKYYILDLSSNNSLVKYLVGQGHTVFMISWKNPGQSDQQLGLDDYINLGVLAAIKAVNSIVPQQKIHTVGYCLGGTMLMIAAAYLANKPNNPLKSLTLFAAQIDFKSAGELLVFIDESQISTLQDMMWEQGYLDGKQMASAFNLLHSNELIWGRIVQDYLVGDRRPLFDLMAWNADATRLPYHMHSEYLEKLFLNNGLVEGELLVNGEGVSLINIDLPMFAVGTVVDHVAPWKSVYKVHYFTKTDLTFVLTTGGHNVGIVSEPGHKGRSYQVKRRKKGECCLLQDEWQKIAPSKEGSWWPEWEEWVAKQSDNIKVPPPSMGNKSQGFNVLYDAPGTYVLQK